MIGKPEILHIAGQINLSPHVVEKDYALGWLLAGIFANQKIREAHGVSNPIPCAEQTLETSSFMLGTEKEMRIAVIASTASRARAQLVRYLPRATRLNSRRQAPCRSCRPIDAPHHPTRGVVTAVGNFLPPAQPAAQTVARRQGRLALRFPPGRPTFTNARCAGRSSVVRKRMAG